MPETCLKMLESDVKRKVREYLLRSGWFVFNIHQQGQFCHRGISDYIAVKNGRVLFIEVKKPVGGKQSSYQIKFERDITEHGGEYLLVNSLESLVEQIDKYKQLRICEAI